MIVDEQVRKAQRFVNSYSVTGIPKIAEDGIPGLSTIYALTRVLQYELGITALSDNFGTGTMTALTAQFPVISSATTDTAVVKVAQSALYCKGYDGGDVDGVYGARVAAAMTRIKTDMGVAATYPGSSLTPKVFKALLTMDAYVVVAGSTGTAAIRSVQQWLNGRYAPRANFFVVPCDGLYTRDIQKALMLGIQFELGLSDDVANGVFGPTTQAGLKQHVLSTGARGVWVQLYSGAMVFNRRTGAAFTGSFDANLATRTREFQTFTKLAVTGRGDYPTWASLLVSTGDTTRRGVAADCVTAITAPRAQALVAAGYKVVGRYLSNVPGSTLNKMIQPGELAVIAAGGLAVFPIYQTVGTSAAYFTAAQGSSDAFAAIDRARAYGFKPGTRIYFVVDFDALDTDVTSNVLPHFTALAATMAEYGSEYLVGVYGSRNVCSRISAAGRSTASFVSDMSTGFSGNLGYSLPADWAFDQISTVTVGTGTGAIQIDNDISSGRDAGQKTFRAAADSSKLDVPFDPARRSALLTDLQAYLVSIGVPESGGAGTEAATVRTTTQALDVLLSLDALTTNLSRALRLRKALIHAPLMWELRKLNVTDGPTDQQVRDHYTSGTGTVTDSTTGLGQILASRAISARNYCVAQNITAGAVLNDPADRWAVWQKLNGDPDYNVGTAALVLIEGANRAGLARPNLTTSEAASTRILAKYNPAANYGTRTIGLYKVFEKYYAPLRNG